MSSMNIQEQWGQDVKDYGGNAYLMWEFDSTHISCEECFGRFITCSSNRGVNILLDSMNVEFKRKQSAELPFDLERAKSGDEVMREVYWREKCGRCILEYYHE
jgi:hypothetical protein